MKNPAPKTTRDLNLKSARLFSSFLRGASYLKSPQNIFEKDRNPFIAHLFWVCQYGSVKSSFASWRLCVNILTFTQRRQDAKKLEIIT
jgi:hypothetical protein